MNTAKKIGNPSELRKVYGDPHAIAVAIEKTYLDKHDKNFIENSPFACIATAGANGQPTISPKGDAPGFVHVVDANTLVVPDRPGNNKVLSFQNLLENTKIALIFFVPGVRETLRVEGDAQLVLDDEVLQLGIARDRLPRAALVINVTKSYMHCGKALIRSNLWDPDSRSGADSIPSFAAVIKEQANAPKSIDEVEELINHEYDAELY